MEMTTDSFIRQITESGHYQTPRKVQRLFADRMFGWSDAWYYIRMLELVVEGSLLARRGLYTPETWIYQSAKTWTIVEGCGGRVDVSGVENVRNSPGPRVYVANHMSLLETFLLPGLVAPFDFAATVLKKELLSVPLFGRMMKAIEPISVTRKNVRQDLRDVMTKGRDALEQGRSILMFPQSTRTAMFDPGKFNSLGTKLADRANVPLLPIAVKTDFMGIGRLIRDFGRIDRSKTVHIKVGRPISVQGNMREAQNSAVDFITSNLLAWGGSVKEQGESPEK